MQGTRAGPGRQRAAGNPALTRLVGAHLLTVVAEYAAFVAVLVFAFDQGGSRGTGLASLAILGATLAGAFVASTLTNRFRPALVRNVGLAAQVAGYAIAAAAMAGGVVPVAIAGSVLALGAVPTLRPTGAVLLPAVVRSTSELTTGTLWISRCECAAALLGPLGVAVLLWAGGPELALAGCGVAAAAALAISLVGTTAAGAGPPPASADRPLAEAIATVRANRGTTGLFGVALAYYVILGALDVLLVVLAFEALDLGSGGVGVLNALVGAGALASMVVATVVVRRTRLAPSLALGLLAAAVLCVILGVATSRPVAVVVLPLLGLVAALCDGIGRMLLQRSADPRALASLFALVELVGGVGMLLGSGLAQIVVAVGDVHWALVALGFVLALILAVSAKAVWHADASADVPVVEMSLLQQLPMFAPLPPINLEALARTAASQPFAAGEEVVRQGDHGDRFYAVVHGELDVSMSGEHIRVLGRGGSFGEVALLADVPRTATVTARSSGELLAIDRVPFLVAVTGSDTSQAAAWGAIHALRFDDGVPVPPVVEP
ncbi:cyclic nucleotide-binding domain-containing protein [Aquihabitans sp. McL0605]|uniref:cyclic nucleotide-binding domain-containing protein n=1 Tax=Aquihabitans sp. McL0605 TaxID=3415671 RepID=UPI003CF9C3EC